MKLSFGAIVFTCIIFVGCAHKEFEYSPTDKASWETKALVKQVKTGQVNNVAIDVFAIKASKLRLEVTATLGYKVASVVLDKDHIQALVVPDKKYYEGFVTPDVIARVLKIPVHPNILYAMIFDQSLRGAGWVCHNDDKGLLKDCAFKDIMSLTWERLPPPQKIVHLKTKSVEMDWLFKTPDPKWEPKEEMFQLQAPESYESIRL